MTAQQRLLSILIVDDERHARETLRSLLERDSEIVVAGEAADGFAAVEAILGLRPDLVFLDVQMPAMDGFETLEALAGEALPRIVFVTAYDRFALRAFDVNAVDYVLKPFDDERLFLALDRAKKAAREGSETGAVGGVGALLESRADAPLRRFPVRSRGRVRYVEIGDVDWIGAADQYVEVHVGDKVHLLRRSMAELERRLPTGFCRIHRSTIVNVDRIQELQPLPSGEAIVVLNGQPAVELRVARQRKYRLEEALGL